MSTDRLDEVLGLLGRLHRLKDAAYGDAWRKRGEVIAIFANLARKYDRLVIAIDEPQGSGPEPLADTAGDLCVYAAKYLTWLAETAPQDFAAQSPWLAADDARADRGPEAVEAIFDGLQAWERSTGTAPPGNADEAWARLRAVFEQLEAGLMAQASATPDPSALLGWRGKTALGWALADASAWLLRKRAEADSRELRGLSREIRRMESGSSSGVRARVAAITERLSV